MFEFTRKIIASEALMQASLTNPPQIPAYQKALLLNIRSAHFTPSQVLAGLVWSLGDKVTQLFLATDTHSTMGVASEIMEDHVRHDVDARPKDLQVNLVVNIVKDIVGNKNLPKANRYESGESLIRRCLFDGEFKYALKCALFDRNAILSPFLNVVHYPPPVTDRSMASNW